MEGCPHQCIYCDQQAVSGFASSPELTMIRDAALSFAGGADAELAFYGGSFSALPEQRQRQYLDAVAPALAAGNIGGIRISTRPDAIDQAELDFLAGYGVKTIELGIQSFDNQVLHQAGRAYTAELAKNACLMVKQHGFALGIQLMTGLPADDRHKALLSAQATCSLHPDMVRIYPTVVLRNTPLAELWRRQQYQPQTVEQAAELCADMLAVFEKAGINVIRLGLNPSAETEQAVLDGPYHPAFGQIVKAKLKYRQMRLLMEEVPQGAIAALTFPVNDMPLVFGQKKQQLLAMAAEYPLLALLPDRQMPQGQLTVTGDFGSKSLSYADFLQAYSSGDCLCI